MNMSMLQAAVEYRINELSEMTNRGWFIKHLGPETGEIVQPNGISTQFDSWGEALNIVSETLDVIRKGDTAWCLH